MGIVGVMAGLPDLEAYRQPMLPIYVLSAVSIAALIVSVSVVLRKPAKQIRITRNGAKNNINDQMS